jgi:peptidylprolyl isomerase
MIAFICLLSALTSAPSSSEAQLGAPSPVDSGEKSGLLVLLTNPPPPADAVAEATYAYALQLGASYHEARIDLDPLVFLVSYRARVEGQTPLLPRQQLWMIQSYAKRQTRQTDVARALPATLDLALPIPLNEEYQMIGYAFGQVDGAAFHQLGWTLDPQAFSAGFVHGFSGQGDSLMKEPALDAALLRFEAEMERRQRVQTEAAAAAGRAALAAFATEPGVTMLPSGVGFRILEASTADLASAPDLNDVVHIRFDARTTDGHIIDSSRLRAGKAAVDEPMPSLFAGLQEVLVRLPTGTRAEILLPPASARGSEWSPDLPGESVLRYELTLDGVERYPGLIP